MRPRLRLTSLSRTAGILYLLFLFLGAAHAQSGTDRETARLAEKGEAIFQEKCSSCHAIGGGDRPTGPDLAGVTSRRDRQWLERFILDPGRVIAEKDPRAMEMLAAYDNLAMPDLGLSRTQVEAVLVFLEHPGEADHAAGEVGAVSPPAEAGDTQHGRALFSGAAAFENGGAPCLACHGFTGLGPAGGAGFGGDLSAVYDNYGAEGVASILEGLPFPTMEPIYADRPLAAGEQADLAAFLRTGGGGAAPAIQGRLALQALIGFAALAAVVLAFGFRRLRAVRRPLVERSELEHPSEGS